MGRQGVGAHGVAATVTVAKHLKDADPWALTSFQFEKAKRRRTRVKELIVSATVDRANILRGYLTGDVYVSGSSFYPHPPYKLRDTKKGTWGFDVKKGRAQSVVCKFCNKQVGAWPSHAKKSKDSTWPDPMLSALYEHMPLCARRWLRTTLSRWHTNQMSPDDEAKVFRWTHQHMKSRGDRDSLYYNQIPKELDGIFDNLPEPPGHPVTQELEVMLIATSRLWETFPVIYVDESATRDMPHVVAMRKLPVPDRVMYKLVRRVGECHMLESPLCAGRLDHRPKCGCWLWSPSEGRWYR